MERTIIENTPNKVGEKVLIKGWINSIRKHGKIAFADVRDRSGVLQVVFEKDLDNLHEEDAVEITGKIKERSQNFFNEKLATGKIEMSAEKIAVLAKSQDFPFDVHQPELKVTLPVLLDNRSASLRNKKVSDIFKVQESITRAFRESLSQLGFMEFHAPTIVATATEGGAQVFPVDYFGHKAFLAQSPQLYKQIMVGAYERVFTVAHAYRAEPSVTTRHLTEYVSLDAEMGFIDSWMEVVRTADLVVKSIFKSVEERNSDILKDYGVEIPKTVEETPVVSLKEALKIIYERTGRDVRNELDMDPEGEREICRWSREKYESDMVFVTHFPTKKRAWYSYANPENTEETLSFDLIGKGLEWISGSQRISNYEDLVNKIESIGQNPESYEIPYVQAFRWGMPPEGGFAIGLERITMNILGLENIRQASIFPRDMERVDKRLTHSVKASRKINLNDSLINFLKENQIDYKLIEHEETLTSEEAAKARGTRLEQGAKALLMLADGNPILAILAASKKLSNTKFKKLLEVKDLRMASADEVLKITGTQIGGVPPFGNLFNVKVYVDSDFVKKEEVIAFNAGCRTKSIIMKSKDFVNLVKPQSGDFGE